MVEIVTAHFARGLERELAAATKRGDQYFKEAMQYLSERDALRAELEKEWIKNGDLREEIEQLKDKIGKPTNRLRKQTDK